MTTGSVAQPGAEAAQVYGSGGFSSGPSANLGDILERVLDKGLVIAGDIQVNLLDIELLTIKVRLLIASADTAKKMGIDWWERDPFLSSKAGDNGDGSRALSERLERIEDALHALTDGRGD